MWNDMSRHYAEKGVEVDKIGNGLIQLLLGQGEFPARQETPGLQFGPDPSAQHSLIAVGHHMRLVGDLEHFFEGNTEFKQLRGALGFRTLDRNGVVQEKALLSIYFDDVGNAGLNSVGRFDFSANVRSAAEAQNLHSYIGRALLRAIQGSLVHHVVDF